MDSYSPPSRTQDFLQRVMLALRFKRGVSGKYSPEVDNYVRNACILGLVKVDPTSPYTPILVSDRVMDDDGFDLNTNERPSTNTVLLLREVVKAARSGVISTLRARMTEYDMPYMDLDSNPSVQAAELCLAICAVGKLAKERVDLFQPHKATEENN